MYILSVGLLYIPLTFVRPGHYSFIEPTKVNADLIIPEGGNNERALDVLATFMRNVIDNEG